MYAEELITKIVNECRYKGTSKVDSYTYYGAIGEACDLIKRELPATPLPEPIMSKKKTGKPVVEGEF